MVEEFSIHWRWIIPRKIISDGIPHGDRTWVCFNFSVAPHKIYNIVLIPGYISRISWMSIS